jgi:Tat protein secretion system quality control protein TatD with DNase activity/ubiquinone/menaquinone biosynthesis C-methylase UbiE
MSTVQRFDHTVKNYIRGRPSYPSALLDILKRKINFKSDFIVADVACGTGKSSELFLDAGIQVVGVEPNEQMRNACPKHKLFKVVEGSAESLNLKDASVDLVSVFQAAHWFRNMTVFLSECRRVLKPGNSGNVMLVWNDHDVVQSPFHREYTQLCRQTNDYTQVTAMARTNDFAKSFFPSTYLVASVPNRQIMTLGGLTSRFFSSSWAPHQGTPEYSEKYQQLASLFDRYKIPLSFLKMGTGEVIYDGESNQTLPSPDLEVIEFQYETLMYYGNVTDVEKSDIWKWLFDTHCHLTDEPSVEKRFSGTRSLKIGGLALMGTQPSDWPLVNNLQKQSSDKKMVAAFGLHPWFTNIGKLNEWQQELRKYLDTPLSIVGEIGLDRTATDPATCTDSRRNSGKIYDWETQVSLFTQQMDMAAEFDKPVSVHMVNATGPMLDILKSLPRLPPRIQFHSYSGSAETVKALLKSKVGPRCYFSFSKLINGRSTKFPELVKAVPEDRIMLESDIHSPEGVDELMMQVCELVALHRGWTLLEAAQKTYSNACTFYGIPPP